MAWDQVQALADSAGEIRFENNASETDRIVHVFAVSGTPGAKYTFLTTGIARPGHELEAVPMFIEMVQRCMNYGAVAATVARTLVGPYGEMGLGISFNSLAAYEAGLATAAADPGFADILVRLGAVMEGGGVGRTELLTRLALATS